MLISDFEKIVIFLFLFKYNMVNKSLFRTHIFKNLNFISLWEEDFLHGFTIRLKSKKQAF